MKSFPLSRIVLVRLVCLSRELCHTKKYSSLSGTIDFLSFNCVRAKHEMLQWIILGDCFFLIRIKRYAVSPGSIRLIQVSEDNTSSEYFLWAMVWIEIVYSFRYNHWIATQVFAIPSVTKRNFSAFRTNQTASYQLICGKHRFSVTRVTLIVNKPSV